MKTLMKTLVRPSGVIKLVGEKSKVDYTAWSSPWKVGEKVRVSDANGDTLNVVVVLEVGDGFVIEMIA